MHGITDQDLWLARAPRRLFAHPTGTRAARRRLTRAAARQEKRRGTTRVRRAR
jgi:hypothetical protein